MPKIPRFLQKVFASNYAATPTGQICQFGSLAGGTAVYSGDPATIQSLPAWLNGWNSATVGSKSPTFQDFNAFQFVVTQQLAYLLQAGVPEYDATTTYYIGSWCQVAGVVYKSVTDNNTGNSTSNPTYWVSPFATVATTGSYVDLSNKPGIIGVGQTWQNMLGSRAKDTVYTNSTGAPILVSTGFFATGGANTTMTAYVGSVVVSVDKGDSTNGGSSATLTFIVPNGATYYITGGKTLTGSAFWSELR